MAHNLEMINGKTFEAYATEEEAIEAWNEYRELCEGNNEHPVDCAPLL